MHTASDRLVRLHQSPTDLLGLLLPARQRSRGSDSCNQLRAGKDGCGPPARGAQEIVSWTTTECAWVAPHLVAVSVSRVVALVWTSQQEMRVRTETSTTAAGSASGRINSPTSSSLVPALLRCLAVVAAVRFPDFHLLHVLAERERRGRGVMTFPAEQEQRGRPMRAGLGNGGRDGRIDDSPCSVPCPTRALPESAWQSRRSCQPISPTRARPVEPSARPHHMAFATCVAYRMVTAKAASTFASWKASVNRLARRLNCLARPARLGEEERG